MWSTLDTKHNLFVIELKTIYVMRYSIEQRAREASGRERFCGKCPYKKDKFCEHLEACNAAFVRGYIKGHKDKGYEMVGKLLYEDYK